MVHVQSANLVYDHLSAPVVGKHAFQAFAAVLLEFPIIPGNLASHNLVFPEVAAAFVPVEAALVFAFICK